MDLLLNLRRDEPGPVPEPDGPKLDQNGRPYDTWRIAGTSIHDPYPDRRSRAA